MVRRCEEERPLCAGRPHCEGLQGNASEPVGLAVGDECAEFGVGVGRAGNAPHAVDCVLEVDPDVLARVLPES